MDTTILPAVSQKYGVHYQFKGKQEDQGRAIGDIQIGMISALALIYIILAWIFQSYITPIIVMSIIPFAIAGALFGHWIMGIDVTLLSLFGLFGCSGIIINDAIILINEYQNITKNRAASYQAILNACSNRLRAILLTSATTIAGLTPLLLETSLQAQFLIPMACSIVFGLAFGTLLLLYLIPVFLYYKELLTRQLQ